MWPTTKPFQYRLREDKGVKTGGRREGYLFSLPRLNPFVQRASEQKREEGREILKFFKKWKLKKWKT